jgi:hypothetical protein
MKIFKRGSMMQEHRKQQASVKAKTAGKVPTFLAHVENVLKCFESF